MDRRQATIQTPWAGSGMDRGVEARPFRALTRREHDVLILLAQRLTDPEIAACLSIGTRTVETHVANILGKLGVANRREAISAAIRLNSIGVSVLWAQGGQQSAP